MLSGALRRFFVHLDAALLFALKKVQKNEAQPGRLGFGRGIREGDPFEIDLDTRSVFFLTASQTGDSQDLPLS